MKKASRSFNLKINKKHVILACLTLFLGITVYANYRLSKTEIPVTETVDGVDIGTYGEVQYVNGTELESYSSDDYFAQARLDRLTSRDEAVETLKTVLEGRDISDEEMATYTMNAVTLSSLIESETAVENLIIASGYEDCVVYLDGKNASVVVKSDGLTASQAAEIKDILLSEVSVENENIRIFEVK